MAHAVLQIIWVARARLGRNDDRGASLVEYALLLALIAIVCFSALQFLGGETTSIYEDTGNSFAN